MTYLDAVILGLLQGLTEFLPVSSSGHLVLAQSLLGVKQPGIAFEVLVHLGSLLAVLIFFRRTLVRMLQSIFDKRLSRERSTIGYLALGTLPAAVLGILLEDFFAAAFSRPLYAAIMLFVTGGILLSTRFATNRHQGFTWRRALVVGLAQAAAIMPGISRSGATISAGLHAGIEPSKAAEFSFLLAIPVIGGAALLKAKQLVNLPSELASQYLIGGFVSFLVSLVAVYLVLAAVRRGKFEYFAYYCFAAGGVGLYLFL
jgi:undecaprenyl-diphosphatase